ncbi:FecR domain-containing protein [Thauera sp.]
MSPPGRIDPAVLRAAAHWYAQLCAGTPNAVERRAHAVWLRADPAHALAWAQIETLRHQLQAVPGQIARETLERAPRAARRRSMLKGIALLLGGGTAGWIGVHGAPPALVATHHTGTGERREVLLADGSTLILNTDSAVDVRYDATQRHIHLLRGEILLQTASDPRPLSVGTPHGKVRPLGTRFTVHLRDAGTRVHVLQHTVALQPGPAVSANEHLLHAGQAAILTRDAVLPQPASEAPDAWTRGLLVVTDLPLDAFLAKLSRYRPGHLGCDPQIAGLRISGAFPVDDTDRALAAVERALPVQVRRFTRYWTVLAPRA